MTLHDTHAPSATGDGETRRLRVPGLWAIGAPAPDAGSTDDAAEYSLGFTSMETYETQIVMQGKAEDLLALLDEAREEVTQSLPTCATCGNPRLIDGTHP